jgi:protein-S-isoprenylcysteine O-methyltransferase Ste14
VKVLFRWLDIAAFLAFLAFAAWSGPRDTAWYVGLGLVAVSTPFWFAARWQLAGSFSVTAQARELVTSGLYAKVRHPVYVFGSVSWLGAVMTLLGWKALVIWVGVLAIQFARVRREERVLAEAFGAEYEAYRSTTWF